MRYLRLAALVAVTLGLTTSGGDPAVAGESLSERDRAMDYGRNYSVVNNTSEPAGPAARADTVSGAVSERCSSRLEAKCSAETTWSTVGQPSAVAAAAGTALELHCPRGAAGVDYREPILCSQGNVAWTCSPTGANAPAEAVSGRQIVTVTGTLSRCVASTLTAQSTCEYTCLDENGGTRPC